MTCNKCFATFKANLDMECPECGGTARFDYGEFSEDEDDDDD